MRLIHKNISDSMTSLILFFVFTTIFSATSVGTMNSVDAPQYALTRALSDKYQTNIDDYSQYIYPDYATFDGKIYSEREPGLSFLAIPNYLYAKIVQSFAYFPYNDINHPGITPDSTVEAITYGLTSGYAALSVVLIFLICRTLNYSFRASMIGAISLGLGSLLWKYSSSFVRQPLATTIMLFLHYMLLRYKFSRKWYAVFGFFVGFLFITDHFSILFILSLCIIAFVQIQEWSKTKIVVSLIGLMIPISIFLLYNTVSFNNPFTSPRQFSNLPILRNPKNIFIANLAWTIPLNLFSNFQIPPEALSYFGQKENDYNAKTTNFWATRHIYKGIFIQSPYLILGIFGLFILRKKSLTARIIATTIAYLLPVSAMYFFYNPTAYDTRYVLPVVGLLTIGVAPAIDYLTNIRHNYLRFVIYFIISVLFLLSIFQNTISAITHFAPHVTGEVRFSFDLLYTPAYQAPNIYRNIYILFQNLFPNIYNSPIIFSYYIFILAIYLCFRYIIQTLQKKKPVVRMNP
jgi:hypothetical protein